MRAATPFGYVAEPSEMAGTGVFLASDHARSITGVTVNVSGSFLMYETDVRNRSIGRESGMSQGEERMSCGKQFGKES